MARRAYRSSQLCVCLLLISNHSQANELSQDFLLYLAELEYQEKAAAEGEKWLDPLRFSEDLENMAKRKSGDSPAASTKTATSNTKQVQHHD